ncbi:hypothetical protein C8J57DRAFT_1245480 [Mycena rebaudengoi]|nr:hypothetical protein C8J57DRAFT_1245480 [Mycena rebaudengoi]
MLQSAFLYPSCIRKMFPVWQRYGGRVARMAPCTPYAPHRQKLAWPHNDLRRSIICSGVMNIFMATLWLPATLVSQVQLSKSSSTVKLRTCVELLPHDIVAIILDLNTFILKPPALKLLLASVYAKTELTYVPYVNFPYRLPPVPVTAPAMESLGYPQYSTCSARPSENCLALRRDGAVHGTAVTSTRLSSDISMGYSILDLIVTLRLYQDPETPKAVKWPSNDAKSFLGSYGGKTERDQIWEHEHGEEMVAYMWRNLASVLPKIQTRYAAVTRQCFNGP